VATKITVSAHIGAPAEKIWDFWTSPEHITQWNFASDDWCCPSAQNDLQVGGLLKVRMEAKDGSFGFDLESKYDEVDYLERLLSTLADGRVVDTCFKEDDQGTHVTTTFDAENQHPVDMQQAGWQSILDNFKSYVERN
jgi:uncharacterized protein YndB with AHSA1/START domain